MSDPSDCAVSIAAMVKDWYESPHKSDIPATLIDRRMARFEPSPALAALAMRERAAEICDKHSYSNNQYVSMRMIDAASEIRALPTTFTDAELLAAAMRLPQVRALIEAASVFADFADLIDAETVGFSQSDTFALIYKDDDAEYHAENFSLARFTAIRAAIAPFRKGAS